MRGLGMALLLLLSECGTILRSVSTIGVAALASAIRWLSYGLKLRLPPTTSPVPSSVPVLLGAGLQARVLVLVLITPSTRTRLLLIRRATLVRTSKSAMIRSPLVVVVTVGTDTDSSKSNSMSIMCTGKYSTGTRVRVGGVISCVLV